MIANNKKVVPRSAIVTTNNIKLTAVNIQPIILRAPLAKHAKMRVLVKISRDLVVFRLAFIAINIPRMSSN